MLAGGPALPDSDPPGQEKQTRSGRNPQRDPSWCYFYHFHKHSEGCFSQLLTQVWVFFVSKTAQQWSERVSSHLAVSRWPTASHDCGLCLGREILFDILLIMKARHSFSLDDPETSITMPFPSGCSCHVVLSIHQTYLLILYSGTANTHTHTHTYTHTLSRPGKCSFIRLSWEHIPESRVTSQCGSCGGLLLMARQVKAPSMAK